MFALDRMLEQARASLQERSPTSRIFRTDRGHAFEVSFGLSDLEVPDNKLLALANEVIE